MSETRQVSEPRPPPDNAKAGRVYDATRFLLAKLRLARGPRSHHLPICRSFIACLLLDQLAVVHLVGGAVDDDVPAVRHAGVRGVQVALRAVELAGLVCLVAVSAGHNAVLAPIMRVELAIGRGGGQIVDGVDTVMAAALQAEDGRMRKRSRRIAKAVLVMPRAATALNVRQRPCIAAPHVPQNPQLDFSA